MSHYKLIVGLGNPGSKYDRTRHNIGFEALENFLDIVRSSKSESFKNISEISDWRSKSKYEISEIRVDSEKVYLLKPMTFMNLSGEAVGEVADFFKISPHQVLVLHDEIDLPLGALRVKEGGGDAGHNGLKSITLRLGTNNYARLRLGVGRPQGQTEGDTNMSDRSRMEVSDWVLSKFSIEEKADYDKLLENSSLAVKELCFSGLKKTQNNLAKLIKT